VVAQDAATLVNYVIPSAMFAGASTTFTVTVQNTGTATWDDNYRLGAVDDQAGDAFKFVNTMPDPGRVHLSPGTTVSPGSTYTFSFPAIAPPTNQTYDVKFRMVHEGVNWFGDVAEVNITLSGPPPIQFPSQDRLRAFRGDFCGIRCSDLLQYGTKDVFFSAMYPAYPDALRAKLRDLYKQHGYTHMPIATAASYHGVYPDYDLTSDPQQFRAILDEIWRDGLIPVVFMIDDGHWPAGFFNTSDINGIMSAVHAKYDPLFAQTKDLIKIACPGWEINGWMFDGGQDPSKNVMTAMFQYLKQQLPDALCYAHFTAGHAAGSGPVTDAADWWRSMQGVLQGILYQADGNDGGPAIAARLDDFTLRFQTGFHSWPTGFDTIAFEYAAYWEVWSGEPESWGDGIGDACMTQTNPPIQGFCNGGTVGLLPPLPVQTLPPAPGSPAPPPAPPAPPPPAPAPAPAPGAIPPDGIDMTQAVVHNSPGDVASWPATTKITRLEVQPGGAFQIDFTKRDGAGSWPDYTPPGFAGPIEYTLWIVENINGQWHTSGGIQIWRDPGMTLWSGGQPSGLAVDWFYDPNRWGPLTTHQPAPGEQVGFFVTAGNARNEHNVTSVRERSNVILVPFPDNSGAKYTYP
jgi:hypothetical protein